MPIKPQPPRPDKQLVIRPAESRDAAAIAALAKALASHEKETSLFSEHAFTSATSGSTPACHFWVAEAQGSCVGFLMGYMGYDLSSASRGLHLGDIFVLPTHRRHGIAQQLFDTAAEWAQAQNGQWISWTAFKHNSEALGFYRALGATMREDIAFMALALS